MAVGLCTAGCNSSRAPGDYLPQDLSETRRSEIAAGTDPALADYNSWRESRGLTRAAVGPAPPETTATIYPGGSALPPGKAKISYNKGGPITVDFSDVDVREAAKVVLGDALSVSYAVDPAVTGRVTMKTAAPVPPGQLLPLFETALSQAGAAIVVRDGLHQVIPLKENEPAPAGTAVEPAGEERSGFGQRAVQLKHIPAKEMAEILKPVAKDGIVRVDNERNIIVLSGSGPDYRAWMDTIATFDVDWLAGRSVGVFTIQSMPAAGMVANLNELMRSENVDTAMVRFSVIDSNNSILAVAKTKSALEAVRRWVARLEAAGSSRKRLHSYTMRFAQATQVAPMIASLLGAENAGDTSGQGTRKGGLSRSDQRGTAGSGGLGSGGLGSGGLGSGGLGRQGSSMTSKTSGQMGGADDGSGDMDAQDGVRSPAMDLGSGLGGGGMSAGMNGGGRGGGSGGVDVFRVVANEQSNTLLIYGSKQEQDRVLELLRTLDVPQRQVMVEATIIEVALNDTLRYGVQFYLNATFAGKPVSVMFADDEAANPAPKSPGFALNFGTPMKAVIDALDQVTRTNVISSPNLMVMNNQSARLVVGDQVPIVTQTQQSPLQSTGNVVVNAVEMRDTGIIFEVTPRISSAGSVTLDIMQEVSTVTGQKPGALAPTIAQRRLQSSVTVGDRETVALGGLYSTQSLASRSTVPGLSQVPLLGKLLGSTNNSGGKTELLILISPRIVNNSADMRSVTQEMKERVFELQRAVAPIRKR